jgi:hypothetical protein
MFRPRWSASDRPPGRAPGPFAPWCLARLHTLCSAAICTTVYPMQPCQKCGGLLLAPTHRGPLGAPGRYGHAPGMAWRPARAAPLRSAGPAGSCPPLRGVQQPDGLSGRRGWGRRLACARSARGGVGRWLACARRTRGRALGRVRSHDSASVRSRLRSIGSVRAAQLADARGADHPPGGGCLRDPTLLVRPPSSSETPPSETPPPALVQNLNSQALYSAQRLALSACLPWPFSCRFPVFERGRRSDPIRIPLRFFRARGEKADADQRAATVHFVGAGARPGGPNCAGIGAAVGSGMGLHGPPLLEALLSGRQAHAFALQDEPCRRTLRRLIVGIKPPSTP